MAAAQQIATVSLMNSPLQAWQQLPVWSKRERLPHSSLWGLMLREVLALTAYLVNDKSWREPSFSLK